MKKAFLVAASMALLATAVQAQTTRRQPPPPPKPPTPPVEMIADVPPPPPPPPQKRGLSDAYTAFLKRNPSVKSLAWTFRNEVIVRLKSGKEERYKLDDEGRKLAEAKYGKLPAPPPPPPPPPVPPVVPKAPVPPTTEQ